MTGTLRRFLVSSATFAASLLFVSIAVAAPKYVDQGTRWTQAERDAFYTGDQGSQMIPLAWFEALKHGDGTPFLADSLARYGYIPLPGRTVKLPIGFSLAGSQQDRMVGMTCAACHTRDLTVKGETFRIDGGPAIADFQSLLSDLDASVRAVLASDAAFLPFAQMVLATATPSTGKLEELRGEVQVWSTRFHVLMDAALPKTKPWGYARLDAVGMIFDRLTGLDLGKPPLYLIPENIHVADAPTRYPFLWNSPVQAMTQWPGFADNGSDLLALSRNLGEVYGVFGTFHPQPSVSWFAPLNRRYNVDNSANYRGLLDLETRVRKLAAPKWQWRVDMTLAKKGEAVFNRAGDAGCVGCHGQTAGPQRLDFDFVRRDTWATPVLDVGTDTRESNLLTRRAKSGSLEGAYIPLAQPSALKPDDAAFIILATSVIGGIIQYEAPFLPQAVAPASRTEASPHDMTLSSSPPDPLGESQRQPPRLDAEPASAAMAGRMGTALPLSRLNPVQVQALRGAFQTPNAGAAFSEVAAVKHLYESRVLYGIWAAAPYLHNGSVPSLAELLKPPAQRIKTFKVGATFDPETVGLAVDQPATASTLTVTGCDALDSGDSNCGHDYGTHLPDDDKRALLEYLKVVGETMAGEAPPAP